MTTTEFPAPAAIGQTVWFDASKYGCGRVLATVEGYDMDSCCPYRVRWADRDGSVHVGGADCEEISPV